METVETVETTPYPAKTRTATGLVNGVLTEAEVTYFSDKIMILVSQNGRLAQWIQVPLSAQSAASLDAVVAPGLRGASSTSLLPSTHLTPRTLFGARGGTRETFGQLVAAQLGSVLALKDAAETRTLVVGLGLDLADAAGDAQAQATYFDVVELVQKTLL